MLLPTAHSKLGRRYGYVPPPRAKPIGTGAVSGIDGADVDNRPRLLSVRDQNLRGTCYAFAVSCLSELHLGSPEHLSAEYVAWRTSDAEWSFPRDEGASVADAMGVAHAWGIPPESAMPYAQVPGSVGSAACDELARARRIGTPCRVDLSALDDVRAVLGAGKGIVIGFRCFANFERTGRDGMIPPRLPGDGLLGGHAMLVAAVHHGLLVMRNSWGPDWGDHGDCYADPAAFTQDVFESLTAA